MCRFLALTLTVASGALAGEARAQSLESIMVAAREHDASLGVARSDVAVRAAEVSLARSALLPSLSLATGYTRNQVEPSQPETRVGSGVPGRIAAVRVREGERVVAGAPLVDLDDGVEASALAAAEAEVETARVELSRIVRGSRGEDIQAANADAETARARAELSRGFAERLGRAGAAGGATVDEIDRAARQSEADAAAARAAEARRSAVLAGRDFAGRVIEVGRRMGRKNVRSDDPVERNDTKILEVVIAVDRPDGLVVGQRVTGYVMASPGRSP